MKSLGYATSANFSPQSVSHEDKKRAIEIIKVLRREKPRIEEFFQTHSLEIVEELINNTWDPEKFHHFFETDVEYSDDGYTIDFETLIKSLNSIKVIIYFIFSQNVDFVG